MRQHVFRLVAGDGEHQLAFIGEVQGVQTKQLADAAHRVVDRQRCLLQFDAAAAGGGELMGDRVNPPRVASRRAFTPLSGRRVWISCVSTAQSLDSAPSSPICSRRLRMVAP